MDVDESAEPPTPGPESKVKRVLREYNLEGFDDRLVEGWLGEEGDRRSLRELAAELNQAILGEAMRQVGLRPLDGEVENQYRFLTSDEVTAAQRTEAERRLERAGLDPDTLRRDFVSHQAVHTYLTDVRQVSLPEDETSAEDVIQNQQDTILRLRNRLVAVTEGSLKSLRNAGYLSIGTFDAMVSVTVYCNDCETAYDIADLLRRRSCDCPEGTD